MAKFFVKNTFVEMNDDDATDVLPSVGFRRHSSCPPPSSRHTALDTFASDEDSSGSPWRTPPASPCGAALALGAEKGSLATGAGTPLCPPIVGYHRIFDTPASDQESSGSSWRTPSVSPRDFGLALGVRTPLRPPAAACHTTFDASASDKESSESSWPTASRSGSSFSLGAELSRPVADARIKLSSKAVAFIPGVSPAAGKPTQAPASGLLTVPAELPDTTLMMRNLPCSFEREDLRQLLNSKGFAGCYDFLYVPMDFNTEYSVGYAFINLTSKEHALRLTDVFDGFRDWPIRSSKVCAITLSQTQGLDANINRFQNSPVMSPKVPGRFKPMLFAGTQQVPFPEPTQKLPKLMIRKQHRRDAA